jgi:hypothetical protein
MDIENQEDFMPLTEEEKALNRRFSAVRVIVENTIFPK